MTAIDRAKELQKNSAGSAPRPHAMRSKAISAIPSSGDGPDANAKPKRWQLNLRMPEDVKHRVRISRGDRREMSDIVIEAIKLYEARYGAAPVLEPAREG